MSRYEFFQKDLFSRLAKPQYGEQNWRTLQMAFHYDLPKDHVEELLGEWADQRLIDIKAYDGMRVSSSQEWPSFPALFNNRTDHGYVRITIRAAGAALVESFPSGPIGFIN